MTYIHTCLLKNLMLGHRQAIFESKWDKLPPSAKYRISSLEVWDNKSPADWMPTHKPTELSRIKLKTQQPVSMMSKHIFTPCACICWKKCAKYAFFYKVVSHFQEKVESTVVLSGEHMVLCSVGGSRQGHQWNAVLQVFLNTVCCLNSL